MIAKDVKLPMYSTDIENYIPHRYPFLLIDKVTELVPKEKIIAQKNISASNQVFQGHFPGNPVYPGVLTLEGVAQTSAVLGAF